MFSTAEVELEAFGSFNQPDLFYEFYPDTYPGRKGLSISLLLGMNAQNCDKCNVILLQESLKSLWNQF